MQWSVIRDLPDGYERQTFKTEELAREGFKRAARKPNRGVALKRNGVLVEAIASFGQHIK